MNHSIQEVLSHLAVNDFFGRKEELAQLQRALEPNGPLVSFVHGIGGIGKSSLLLRFVTEARDDGVPVLLLDCREIEPTRDGFLSALRKASGQELASQSQLGERLGSLGERVLLVLDHYEVFRLMDTWLRQSFIPSLTDNVRLVMAGREPPVSAWRLKPGWAALFNSVNLSALKDADALSMLKAYGVPDEAIGQINGYAKGNPLVLKLSATAIRERPDLKLQDIKSHAVIPQLIQVYVEDVPDEIARQAIEAISVVRRVTQSLLGVLLPQAAPQDAFERLAKLPFVNRGSDGLIVHETVRAAIADNLKATNPSRYRELRYLAYRQYRKELRSMSPEDTWRYTADFLYMIEEPVIREAFFPSDLQPYAVEVSTAADHDVIRAITAKHEGPEACAAIDHLLEKIPEVFRVARDAHDSVQGYYLVIDPHAMNAADFADDPLMAGWWQHLQDNPIPKGQSVLFLRRWLGSDKGELPSPEQAACWLDVKGDYIRMRAVLRRVYTTAIDVPTYAPVLTRLGFELVPELEIRLGKDSYHTALLDFGPGLILQWFDDQVRAALEMDEKFLDFSAREVILDSGRVGLTPLEFGVLSYLYDHEGSAISRGDLLNHVWGHNYEGGSNVVDTKVRSLRKKLGPYADTIETVSGVGYRYRNPA